MNTNFNKSTNGYQETINLGIASIQSFKPGLTRGSLSRNEAIVLLKNEIESADAVVIGAGSGLSTAAGYTYTGERLEKYFFDFIEKYNIPDMYTGGFVVMNLKPEIKWAYWSRYVYINRYMNPPKPVYEKLWDLVKDKDYFVITTNVDHCFQKAGFDKQRLFYTQGDYGLFQCSTPCHNKTYDNEEVIKEMVLSQGFTIGEDGELIVPEAKSIKMEIPSDLVPYCPICGEEMSMNLRGDDTFVEDEGWYKASAAYADFLHRVEKKHVFYMEIGVGGNTPVIIKYPFWAMTNQNPNAVYACLNYNEAYAPKQIENQSICIDGDFEEILNQLNTI